MMRTYKSDKFQQVVLALDQIVEKDNTNRRNGFLKQSQPLILILYIHRPSKKKDPKRLRKIESKKRKAGTKRKKKQVPKTQRKGTENGKKKRKWEIDNVSVTARETHHKREYIFRDCGKP